MFAPPIFKSPEKAGTYGTSGPKRSPLGYRSHLGPVELALNLQRTIGNQATLRLLAARTTNIATAALPSTLARANDVGASNPSTADGGSPQDAGSAPDAGSADEKPIWHPTSSVPFPINSDTVQDFIHKANEARGAGGEVGHMQANISYNPDVDATGKITKVNLTVETSIVRPSKALSRPTTDVQRAAIARAEELIKEHEERHRDIARDFAARMVKAMGGKSIAAARRAFDRLIKEMDQAQAQYDKQKGCISAHEKSGADGKVTEIDVELGPCPAEKK